MIPDVCAWLRRWESGREATLDMRPCLPKMDQRNSAEADRRDEPILWVADAVALAYGAGNRWALRADRVIDRLTELRPSRAQPSFQAKGLATGSTSHSACHGHLQVRAPRRLIASRFRRARSPAPAIGGTVVETERQLIVADPIAVRR